MSAELQDLLVCSVRPEKQLNGEDSDIPYHNTPQSPHKTPATISHPATDFPPRPYSHPARHTSHHRPWDPIQPLPPIKRLLRLLTREIIHARILRGFIASKVTGILHMYLLLRLLG
jgi:hypothetical protein